MELEGKAVCYSRVSTHHDDQAESLEAQNQLMDKFLKEHPELQCEGKYADQESGKTTERKGYLSLLERVSHGDIDYILAKNNTRLSRSTEISSSLNRVCQKYGTKIFFVGNNELYDPKDRAHVLMNSIKSAVAEDYVYQQSELGKLSHMIKCRDARLSRQNETYGYRFNDDTGQMEIIEEEAAVVRRIFELYCYQNMGVSEIGRELAKIGIYGKRSGKTMNAVTITKRLKDTAYIGKMAFNKSETELVTGVGAKSIRKPKPKSEWVYAECPAIISEELFDLAQIIREERVRVFSLSHKGNRNDTQARFSGHHLFARKVFCGECGNPYHHRYGDRKEEVHVYKDSFRKKSHKPGEECCNDDYNQIYEEQLIEITTAAINTFLERQDEVFENVFNVVAQVLRSNNSDKSKADDEAIYNRSLKEKDKWLAAYKDAVDLGDNKFKEEVLAKFRKASEAAEEAKKRLDEVSGKQDQLEKLNDRLKKIKDRIKAMQKIETLTRDDVTMLVDSIVINKDGTVEVHLLFSEMYSYKVEPYKEYRKTRNESSILLYELLGLDEIEELLAGKMLTQGTQGVSRPVTATA